MAAGLGFKDFVTGEVLTAADVDGYLMQGVWVFADATARTAAVTSPQEGNYSFLKDTNSTEYYDGSAWVAVGGGGGGKVLQVVQATLTGYVNTTSTSYATTGLTQSITPSSATSKVLVMVNLSSAVKNTGNAATALQVKLLRDATQISFAGDNLGHTAVSDKNNFGSVAFTYLDSPATTSATTYVIHYASKTSGQEVGINDYSASNTAVSSIVLLEIGA